MSLEKIINDAWETKDQVNQNSDQILKDAINEVISDLDSGKSRVAEKIDGKWVTHQHLKKAIMLSFRIYPMENLNGPYRIICWKKCCLNAVLCKYWCLYR